MERSFATWVGHRLIPRLYFQSQFVYQEGESIAGVFFIKRGSLGFVLKNHDNHTYYTTGSGHFIGFEDYLLPLLHNQSDDENCPTLKMTQKHTRQFSVLAASKVEALELSSEVLLDVGEEFPGTYQTLFKIAEERLERLITRKSKCISAFSP